MSWQTRLSNSDLLKIKFEKNKLASMQVKCLSANNLRLIENNRIVVVRGEIQNTREELLEKAHKIVSHGQLIDYDFPSQVSYRQVPQPSLNYYEQLDKEFLVHLGETICQKVRQVSSHLVADVEIVRQKSSCELENSFDIHGAYQAFDFNLSILVTGCQENDIFFWGKSYASLPQSQHELDTFIDDLIAELSALQTISSIKSGVYPFLLPPDIVMNNCLSVLETGFSHKFLENKTSPLSNRVGEKILSSAFTLIDKAEFIPFDIDGIPCEPKVFFQNGVLQNVPVPLESARKLGLAPNGSAVFEACSYAASLDLAAGSNNLADLFRQIDEGVLLLMSGDMVQGNIIGGSLSGTVQTALHVRNGQICGRIKNRSLSFNFYEAFADDKLMFSSETGRFGGSAYMEGPWALVHGVSVR